MSRILYAFSLRFGAEVTKQGRVHDWALGVNYSAPDKSRPSDCRSFRILGYASASMRWFPYFDLKKLFGVYSSGSFLRPTRQARHTSLVKLRIIFRVRLFLPITSNACFNLEVSNPGFPAPFDVMPRCRTQTAF